MDRYFELFVKVHFKDFNFNQWYFEITDFLYNYVSISVVSFNVQFNIFSAGYSWIETIRYVRKYGQN